MANYERLQGIEVSATPIWLHEQLPPQLESLIAPIFPPKRATVFANSAQIQDPNEIEGISISAIHGRDVVMELPEEIFGFYVDGQLLTVLNQKGGKMHRPGLRYDKVLDNPATSGLAEEDFLEATTNTAETLSKIGVASEVILQASRLRSFMLPNSPEQVSLETLREKLRADALKLFRLGKINGKQYQKSVDYINRTQYIAQLRGQPVGERIADWRTAKSKNDFRRMIASAMRYFTKYQELYYKQHELSGAVVLLHSGYLADEELEQISSTEISEFEEQGDKHIDLFLRRILPRLIARNMAKMHREKAVHRFTHAQNIFTVGALADLDSPKGTIFGDEEDLPEFVNGNKKNESIFGDFDTVLFGGNSVIRVLEQLEERDYIAKGVSKEFMINFLQEYFPKRWGENWHKEYDAFLYLLFLSIRFTNPEHLFAMTDFIQSVFSDNETAMQLFSHLKQPPVETYVEALENADIEEFQRSTIKTIFKRDKGRDHGEISLRLYVLIASKMREKAKQLGIPFDASQSIIGEFIELAARTYVDGMIMKDEQLQERLTRHEENLIQMAGSEWLNPFDDFFFEDPRPEFQ